jgi:hypothetical protein
MRNDIGNTPSPRHRKPPSQGRLGRGLSGIKNARAGRHAVAAVRRTRTGAAVLGTTATVSLVALITAAGAEPAPPANDPPPAVAPAPAAPAPALEAQASADPPAAPTPETQASTETPAAPSTSTAAPESEEQSAPETRPQPVTKSLTVDYQAQKTGYWCGPAAARIALSSQTKKLPDQAALATEIGTTTNGTDHISQVVDGLNKRLAGTGTQYVTRDWADRPLTSAMTQQLWSDTLRNIDDGKAMVANIVAPPGNQPPGYPSSQTIYHYVTIVGYNTEDKTVHISDPARFSGKEEYWLSLDKVASLIQPRGYAA